MSAQRTLKRPTSCAGIGLHSGRKVTLSLKPTGVPPGDVTSAQLEFIADLADRHSFGEARVSHEQNVILADVREAVLFALWEAAKAQGLATPNIGLLTNIISCPGGDFCSLANAKSIPRLTSAASRCSTVSTRTASRIRPVA